jgi:hypothetical protein
LRALFGGVQMLNSDFRVDLNALFQFDSSLTSTPKLSSIKNFSYLSPGERHKQRAYFDVSLFLLCLEIV